MKVSRRKCLSCKKLRALSIGIGVCTNCRLRLFDNGGLTAMSMYNLYNIDKKTLEELNNKNELIPEVNPDGYWRYPANTVKRYFFANKDILSKLVDEAAEKTESSDSQYNSSGFHEQNEQKEQKPTDVNKSGIEIETRPEAICLRCRKNPQQKLSLSLCNECVEKVFRDSKISMYNIEIIYGIKEEELKKLDENGIFKANLKIGEKWFYSKLNLIVYLNYRNHTVNNSANKKNESELKTSYNKNEEKLTIICEEKLSIVSSLVVLKEGKYIRLCRKSRTFSGVSYSKGLKMAPELFDDLCKEILSKRYAKITNLETSIKTYRKNNTITIEIMHGAEDSQNQKLSYDSGELQILFQKYTETIDD